MYLYYHCSSCLANLNDRSLVGDRDSEVCIILEDKELVQIIFVIWYKVIVSHHTHTFVTKMFHHFRNAHEC